MQLIGYSCRHSVPPLRRAHLPLGPLTVLLGRNDSGKSTLLRAIERDLAGGHFSDTDEESARYIGGAFFAEASDEELRALVTEGVNVRKRLRDRSKTYLGQRPPYGRARWWEDFRLEGDADPLTSWIAALRSFKATEGFEKVWDALERSRIVALEPAGHDEGRRVWNVYWCLRPFDDLPAEVQGALSASDLSPFKENRERAEAEEAGKSHGWFTRGSYAPFHGTPWHLWLADAPVVVSPLGQTRSIQMPRGLAVPRDFSALRADVAAAMNELVNAARHGFDDVRREGDPLSPEEEHAREAPRNWLEAHDSGWRVHPDAAGAAGFIRAAANRLLPGFVSETYRLEVVLRPLPEWVGDQGEALDIRLRQFGLEPLVVEFPIEDVADGLRLWVQLALLEACEQAARVASHLVDVAEDWWPLAEQANHVRSSGDDDSAEDLEAQADHYESESNAMLEDLRGLAGGERSWLEGDLATRLENADPDNWTRRLARHRRYFIVDEPERHLHPNLQREAAVWLKETVEGRGAPCVVATHGTPFLGLPSDAQGPLYVYVKRDGDEVRCEPFDAGELRRLDDIVTSLGFDRGELLTTVSMFLVVEGIHDVAVLEPVFDELRAARIALLPMEGLSNFKAVLDADALWRYTTAEVALTTDKFDEEWLARVVADPAEAKALRRSDAAEETKLLGKLIGLAQMNGKTIHLMGHRGADLIDVLDEDIVIQEFPKYPGHEAATRLWDEEVKTGAKASQKKGFYEEQFALPMRVESYARLGQALAAANRKPAALQRIVDDAVAIASGKPPSNAVSVPTA